MNNQVIDMKFGLNGGQDFYWIKKNKDNELDRRGGILLKKSGIS